MKLIHELPIGKPVIFEFYHRARQTAMYGQIRMLKFVNLNVSGWPSGLRRWIKAPISSEAWVRIPLQTIFF